jgi:hypothetical protein
MWGKRSMEGHSRPYYYDVLATHPGMKELKT